MTGSVALTGPEKFPPKATYDPADFSRTAWINLGAKVLTVLINFEEIGTRKAGNILFYKLDDCQTVLHVMLLFYKHTLHVQVQHD